MTLKRRSKSTPVEVKPVGLIPLVDADYIIYQAGFAGQYKLKHMMKHASLKGEALATFRYVKEMKDWIEAEGLVLDSTVFIKEEQILEPVENVLHTVKVMVGEVAKKFGCTPRLYLTGSGNYREGIANEQEYKGNRKNVERPHYKDVIIDYLKEKYNATLCVGLEADDIVALMQEQYQKGIPVEYRETQAISCIVHIDKDIKQVPGWHYNPNIDDLYYVSELEGWRFFYKQLLMGDATDHIPGIKGVGEKTADKILDGLNSEMELFIAVLTTYMTKLKLDEWQARNMMTNRGQLLYMLREPGKIWFPPIQGLYG